MTNSDTDITITEEEIIEIIEISGWTRAKFHGTSETQSFKDTFVIYTSDTDYVDFGYWLNTRNTDDPLSLSYVVDGFVFGPRYRIQ